MKISYKIFMLLGEVVLAFPPYEKQQPELPKGITHGIAPTGDSDYISITATPVIV